MLSSLSSLADRNFVIAYVLPVILAALWLIAALKDVAAVDAVWSTILDADKFAALTLFVLALWVAAVSLTFINLPLYRVLEGYLPPLDSRLVKALRDRRYDIDLAALKARNDAVGDDTDLRDAYNDAVRKFRARYPKDPVLLVPTRLGNALKSAEAYAHDVYGADSVAIWARFAAVMPESFAKLVDGARAEMDCFVNAVFLSFLVSSITAVHFLKGLVEAGSAGKLDEFSWSYVLVPVLGFASCRLWYRFAVLKAVSWGELFRAAFDLYLPDLAKQLGYELPGTAADRKAFWGKVNALCLDGIEIRPEGLAAAKLDDKPKAGEVGVIVSGRPVA